MKKYILILIITVVWSSVVLAWNECPLGEVNDPYPGKCGLYTDTDNDGICDYSQPAPEDRDSIVADTNINDNKNTSESPGNTETEDVHDLITGKELKTKTVSEVAEIYNIPTAKYAQALSEYFGLKIKKNDKFQLLHDNYGLEPKAAKDVASMVRGDEDIVVTESEVISQKRVYHLVPIAIVLIILYFVTYFLSKKKIITKIAHRRIWNILLLITFLVSGILGILLIIRINFTIPINLPFNILFWHVEAGIAMTLISFFHAFWHWNYYKCIFKKRRNREDRSCEK